MIQLVDPVFSIPDLRAKKAFRIRDPVDLQEFLTDIIS